MFQITAIFDKSHNRNSKKNPKAEMAYRSENYNPCQQIKNVHMLNASYVFFFMKFEYNYYKRYGVVNTRIFRFSSVAFHFMHVNYYQDYVISISLQKEEIYLFPSMHVLGILDSNSPFGTAISYARSSQNTWR